jgi:uncharacterized protein (DUF2267 family)
MIGYDAFISAVAHEAHAPRPEAERAVRATLQTLAERISTGEARDIAEQLPPPLRPLLDSDGDAEPFTIEEFLRRVAEREGAGDIGTAEQHAAAVFAALGAAVSRDEIEDMASELPKEFDSLLLAAAAPAPPPEPEPHVTLSEQDFEERVARRAGLDRAAARRATAAVLETLGDRISGGEVEDLAQRLPPRLREPLERGDAASHGAARPLSLKEFVLAVSERAGVTPDHAFEQARAVFATLREAVGPKEFSDVAAQLPDEYHALLAPP